MGQVTAHHNDLSQVADLHLPATLLPGLDRGLLITLLHVRGAMLFLGHHR